MVCAASRRAAQVTAGAQEPPLVGAAGSKPATARVQRALTTPHNLYQQRPFPHWYHDPRQPPYSTGFRVTKCVTATRRTCGRRLRQRRRYERLGFIAAEPADVNRKVALGRSTPRDLVSDAGDGRPPGSVGGRDGARRPLPCGGSRVITSAARGMTGGSGRAVVAVIPPRAGGGRGARGRPCIARCRTAPRRRLRRLPPVRRG